jgi:hypothetical protein
VVADRSTVNPSARGDAFKVEVRRPLQSANPNRRFRMRWRTRSDQRRAARAERKQNGEKTRWWEAFDVPLGDMDGGAAAVLAIVAAILLVVILILAGPFIWILLLFAVELVMWLVLAIAGFAAWLVLGRPWRVVITDQYDNTLASIPVPGRQRAREHAAVVVKRLSDGASPTAAITVTAL